MLKVGNCYLLGQNYIKLTETLSKLQTCSVIKNVNKAVLTQTLMSAVIHCFALKKQKVSVL